MGSYAQSVHEKMLANLTSLIWGNDSNPSTTTATTTTTTTGAAVATVATPANDDGAFVEPPTGAEASNFRALTPADEDLADWVLVDRAEVDEASYDEGLTSQLMPSPAATTSTTATRTPVPALSPLSSGGESSEGGVQEWLVTPPPCFTRSQAAPIATSPLENLLIEHPSMSVYLPRPTYTSAATARIFPRRVMSKSSPLSHSPPSVSPSSLRTSGESDGSPMREDPATEEVSGSQQQVETTATPRSVTQRAASLLQAIDVLRPAQKAQRRRMERRLKHKHLDRSNKAREVASAGNKRSKRCDMMSPGKFSRAVNNRKC